MKIQPAIIPTDIPEIPILPEKKQLTPMRIGICMIVAINVILSSPSPLKRIAECG